MGAGVFANLIFVLINAVMKTTSSHESYLRASPTFFLYWLFCVKTQVYSTCLVGVKKVLDGKWLGKNKNVIAVLQEYTAWLWLSETKLRAGKPLFFKLIKPQVDCWEIIWKGFLCGMCIC